MRTFLGRWSSTQSSTLSIGNGCVCFFCILRLRYHAGSQPAAKRESTEHQLIQVIFVNGSKLTIRGFPRVTSDRETDKEEPDRDRIDESDRATESAKPS